MLSVDLESGAIAHYEDRVAKGLTPEYALSTASLINQPLDVILDRARESLPHSMMRTSTIGELLNAGYEIRLTDEATAHADLLLPSVPSEALWEALRAVFGPEQPNPVRRGKGGRA
jgi:hypothetical protein